VTIAFYFEFCAHLLYVPLAQLSDIPKAEKTFLLIKKKRGPLTFLADALKESARKS
jgi:hypothetical protein